MTSGADLVEFFTGLDCHALGYIKIDTDYPDEEVGTICNLDVQTIRKLQKVYM